MNQLKFYKAFTVLLVLLNVGVISFLLLNTHRPPHHGKPLFKIIEHKLELNEQQKATFKDLREAHRQQIAKLDESRNSLLNDYFETLKHSENGDNLNELMDEIKNVAQQRIDVTYAHFNDIKALCNKEQLAQFPEVLDIAIERLLTSDKKGPPPPRH